MSETVTTPARVRLGTLPTPLQETPRLAHALGLCGPLLVKRDDLTGFATGGNKVRQLELLLADAEREGADVLVTGGSVASNFVAVAAAAAAHGGLANVTVLAGPPVPPPTHPNLAAALAWGADARWTGDPERSSVDAALPAVAAELTAAGARPYVVPRGGASPLGATGFRLAYDELLDQLDGGGVIAPGQAVTVVVATGSGGTLAGLLAGAVARGGVHRVVGVSVSRPVEQVEGTVLRLAQGVAELCEEPAARPQDVRLIDGRGPGHGVASPAGRTAADTALRTEGLLVDPVYTAKALAALPALAGDGPVVFWHTGGILDAVADWLDRPATQTRMSG